MMIPRKPANPSRTEGPDTPRKTDTRFPKPPDESEPLPSETEEGDYPEDGE